MMNGLWVDLSDRMSPEPHVQTSPNFCACCPLPCPILL